MLAYFPELYDDELIYSIAARYGRHTGKNSYDVAEALFGSKTTRYFDLSPHLEVLASRLPRARQLTTAYLEQKHTLLPFYLAGFEPHEKIRRTEHFRKQGRAGVPSAGSVVSSLKSRKVTKPSHIRFCLACCVADYAARGEFYWRRTHQIAAVLVCPTHGEVLRAGPKRRDSCILLAATPSTCPASAPEVLTGLTHSQKTDLLSLAKRCQKILESGETIPADGDAWLKEFRIKCRERDLGGGTRGLDRAKVLDLASKRFGYLHGLWPKVFNETTWLFRPVRGSNPEPTSSNVANLSPVVTFLFETAVEAVPKQESAHVRAKREFSRVFGDGPWPCLNPLCPDHLENVIEEIKLEYVQEKMCVRAHLRHFCGHYYIRTSNKNGHSTYRTITYGPLLTTYLLWAKATGYTFSATRKAARINDVIMKRAAVEAGINDWGNLGRGDRLISPLVAFKRMRMG